jgi:hypothetical protein
MGYSGLKQAETFLVHGKAPFIELAVDHFAVQLNIKDAATSGNEFNGFKSMLFKIIRQTGGAWFVVSNLTIGYADHAASL